MREIEIEVDSRERESERARNQKCPRETANKRLGIGKTKIKRREDGCKEEKKRRRGRNTDIVEDRSE